MSLAFHLLLGAKVGGVPILVSIFNLRRQNGDTPQSWSQGTENEPL